MLHRSPYFRGHDICHCAIINQSFHVHYFSGLVVYFNAMDEGLTERRRVIQCMWVSNSIQLRYVYYEGIDRIHGGAYYILCDMYCWTRGGYILECWLLSFEDFSFFVR